MINKTNIASNETRRAFTVSKDPFSAANTRPLVVNAVAMYHFHSTKLLARRQSGKFAPSSFRPFCIPFVLLLFLFSQHEPIVYQLFCQTMPILKNWLFIMIAHDFKTSLRIDTRHTHTKSKRAMDPIFGAPSCFNRQWLHTVVIVVINHMTTFKMICNKFAITKFFLTV